MQKFKKRLITINITFIDVVKKLKVKLLRTFYEIMYKHLRVVVSFYLINKKARLVFKYLHFKKKRITLILIDFTTYPYLKKY